MHTRAFVYTDGDMEYANENEYSRPTIYFHYSNDLSGSIIIEKTADEDVSISKTIEEMKIPGWMLLDFVGEHYGRELISMLENKTGREILKLLSGV